MGSASQFVRRRRSDAAESRAHHGERAKKLRPIDSAMDDARRRSASGDWEGSTATTFVGLYAFCHDLTHGVVPEELAERGLFSAAVRVASAMLRDRFGGDADAMASFVVWSWEREKGREDYAQRVGNTRNRMSWRLQFSAAFFTDYLVDQKRTASRSRRS